MSLNIVNITEKCNVCDSGELAEVFSSRKMPLTGLYLNKVSKPDELCNDQSFLQCLNCGHGQLKNIISPSDLYDKTYKHRSTQSTISSNGNDFFYRYLSKIIDGRRDFKNILEIGCNDLVLIKKIQDIGAKITGIDPIWQGKDFSYNSKTNVFGCFVNEVDHYINSDMKPDLILSAHTFEHVDRTFEQFNKLVEIAADDCLFIIEMPSYDTLLKTGRFDQVFHQHLQYLNISSMTHLINRLGCEYVDHCYNHSYWGGTILFSFRKTKNMSSIENPQFSFSNVSSVIYKYSVFKDKLSKDLELLLDTREPIYGFGAAQMLPIIAHHLSSDLSFMEGIIDDNPDRVGTFLPSISCSTISSTAVKNLSDAVCLITAIDSSRPILKRLLELNPRRIAQFFPII